MAMESCKRGGIESRVKAGVIPKFCQSQVLVPLVWVGVGEASEVNLQALIDALGLPVRLGMVGRAHTQLSASILEQLVPKHAGEYWVFV